MFYKGDIHIPVAVKAGMTGGITDCASLSEGEWLHIAFNDKGMEASSLDWRGLHLPHDWCVEQQYVGDDSIGARAGSHGYLPTGVGFYRKTFKVPQEGVDKKWGIRFDGVTGTSTVWVNGHLLGEHQGGYIGFSYDLTDVLRYVEESDNVILVKVDTTEYEGWWYEGSGIYRHVWLEQTDGLHIAENGTYITTPIVTNEFAEVYVQTRIRNVYTDEARIQLLTNIYDAEGSLVHAAEAQASIDWYTEHEIQQSIQIEKPRLWSPDHPVLYKAVSIVKHGERIADIYETTFGIRSIRFDRNEGFFLNGEYLPIQGTCVHQDFAGVGVACRTA